MIDPSYLQALAAARMVTATPAAKGIPTWRERGLATVDLLIATFVDRAGRFWRPTVVEHPFLMPAEDYRRVFGVYTNTYAAQVPGLAGRWVLRPDNLHVNAAVCHDAGTRGPVVATGGLLRDLRGGAAPLFRDRHIWPAVQATHLVDPAEATVTLDRWRQAVEATIAAAALPVVTVEPVAPSPYGRRCLLAVSCLPDGRPTVLATLYILSDTYRRPLGGGDAAIIDVGFTGKIIAVAAMHHRDDRGLVLPSALAPTQVGVVSTAGQPVGDRWRAALAASAVRATVTDVVDRTSARWRAERRLHRAAVPLVVSAPGHVLVRRMPLRRAPVAGLTAATAATTVATELDAHDRRLSAHSAGRFDRGLLHSGRLPVLCPDCAPAAVPPLYGWTHPPDPGACVSCGRPGRRALLSEAARIY
jgi:prolyl-tRNA synthetase